MTADAAIKKIEGWEEALEDVEVLGTKSIMRDLQALKRQLSRDEPDGDRVRHLMAKLADSAMTIAERMNDRNSDKLRDLGDALEAAAEEEDEDEGYSSRGRGRSRRDEEDEDERYASRGRSSSSGRYATDEDDRRGPSGRVKDPENDRRLRGQESERLYESRRTGHPGQGEVQDPEHDRRLKSNRGNGGRSRRDEDEDYDRPSRSRSRYEEEEDDRSSHGASSRSRPRDDDDEMESRSRSQSASASRSRSREDEDDNDVRRGGQGRVKDPESDRRLRENRR